MLKEKIDIEYEFHNIEDLSTNEQIIQKICNDNAILDTYKNKILDLAKLLPSWQERINKEVSLLEDIVNKRNYK